MRRKLSLQEKAKIKKEVVEPPNDKLNLTSTEIEMFSETGKIGWKFFCEKLLSGDTNLINDFKHRNNMRELNNLLEEYEPDRNKRALIL